MKNWHIGMGETREDLEPKVEQTESQTTMIAGGMKVSETAVIKA